MGVKSVINSFIAPLKLEFLLGEGMCDVYNFILFQNCPQFYFRFLSLKKKH